ncbi:MAG: ferredoxin [Candidatus Heimdallarchaeum aukensis]|uniref:Ferredoxin n=1 Tax=Candidatus Heimdallarchaeum aukensis TaxID=2876573 RepID=A0A9Y1BMC9_9ARCH|nr:MAG: ferredoxin [Candidatus Heimdallarchaeum aukensis]
MVKYKITINRDECIACGLCYSDDPEHFKADDSDISMVVGGETTDDLSEGHFDDDEIENVRDIASECPAEIIHVTEE